MKWTTAYDEIIAQAVVRYLGFASWEPIEIKAQLAAESKLDPHVVASDGGQGIAQFMPLTWASIAKQMKLPASASPLVASDAIPAMCFYMAQLTRAWWMQPRTDEDRHRLAQASYNAGLKNIVKAQKLSGGALDYTTVIAELPKVTRSNAQITIAYIDRIARYRAEMTE